MQPPPVTRYIVFMNETLPDELAAAIAKLPAADDLVKVARLAMEQATRLPRDPDAVRERRREVASAALDQWAPDIDVLADLAGIAAFLKLKSAVSLRQNKFRSRADGTPAWPEPDASFGRIGSGRAEAWTIRTIVIHRAESPGRGHPGATLGRARHKELTDG